MAQYKNIAPPVDLKKQVKELKREHRFGEARKLLEGGHPQHPENLWIRQQQALCTYKDQDLQPHRRFDRALEILEELGLRDADERKVASAGRSLHDLAKMDDGHTETLALGGAIYKRMWEYYGSIEFLHESYAYYRAAYDYNPYYDMGYGGVNAAFVLDILAARAKEVARRSGTAESEITRLRQEARDLRADMAQNLPKYAADVAKRRGRDLEQEYWYRVTLAEICFGLGDYKATEAHLRAARQLDADDWELQTTFKQLVTIARLDGKTAPPDGVKPEDWEPWWQALDALLTPNTHTALGVYRGKVGLALSGGGFRASFFHLGVMARLAEMDALRCIEVLSTVSGGSIVGAHYYLELKRRLENTTDAELGPEDYATIVQTVSEQFFAGVKSNIRTRMLSNLFVNLKLLFSKSYSRTHRLGELYESELYARVDDGNGAGPRYMDELLITPQDGEESEKHKPKGAFNPVYDNWRRRAKVPILLLNTTTLNTGHSWQFTAKWMGEPPGLLGDDIDMNDRLRRVYYEDVPPHLMKYRLGHAVAASACVPGLFEPILIDGLYEGRQVRLVDGGVHDNQGIQGLLDQACTICLISDATGQMEDLAEPANTVLGVPLRSFSISMDRVREAQFQDLQARLASKTLDGLFFVHLKQDLESRNVDWVGSKDPNPRPRATTGNKTAYGIDREIQASLAGIRTDLDSFTEVEAQALMLSGYLMTKQQFEALQYEHEKSGGEGNWCNFTVDAPEGDWPFLNLRAIASRPESPGDRARAVLGKQLKVASKVVFKVFHSVPLLKYLALALIAAVAVGTAYLIFVHFRDREIVWSVGEIAITVAAAAALFLLPWLKYLMPERVSREIVTKIGVAVFGWVAANVHLGLFDKIYQIRGRLARLLKSDKSTTT